MNKYVASRCIAQLFPGSQQNLCKLLTNNRVENKTRSTQTKINVWHYFAHVKLQILRQSLYSVIDAVKFTLIQISSMLHHALEIAKWLIRLLYWADSINIGNKRSHLYHNDIITHNCALTGFLENWWWNFHLI